MRSQHPTDAELPPPPPDPPCPHVLNTLLFPYERNLRQRVLHLLNDPLFHRRTNLSVRQHRDLTNARMKRVQRAGLLANTISQQNAAGSRRYDAVISVLALLDHSLEVKFGVSFGLFGATVHHLGTQAQRDLWLPRLESMAVSGCFALTELGHGSNVRAIETTATYVARAHHFDLHTPTETAQKYWIGGAAESASHAVVFAQLAVGAARHGIHAFIVRLRNDDGSVAPGVRIADCGEKAGLNGVDNGRIWFTHVRVAREHMLSRISRVAPDGTYWSSIASPAERFGTMLGALTGGRIGICFQAPINAMLALCIAVRYSFARRAFAPAPGAAEVPLMFYTSQRRMLMVPLATSYVYALCARDLADAWYGAIDGGRGVPKRVHVASAGYKALFTWFMQDALQAAREACGGQGYKADNWIAPLKADRDVMLTFEGVNGVLLQQVGKALLAADAADDGDHAGQDGHDDDDDEVGDDDDDDDGDEADDDGDEADVDGGDGDGGGARRRGKLDSRFFDGAFRRLERAQVAQLRARYAAALRRRRGCAFRAWNDSLPHAERAARAHLRRALHGAHRARVRRARARHAGTARALALCGRLWAAHALQRDAELLRLRCVSRADASRAARLVDALCARVAAIAPQLLAGAGIPDALLAPIAVDYVAHNSRARL